MSNDGSHLTLPSPLDDRLARHSRSYRCRCANRLFFRNTLCLACTSQLGYLPEERRLAALEPGEAAGTWRVEGRDDVLRFCANRESAALCNWLTSSQSDYCVACRLNRTIPRLDDPDNVRYWARIEVAKRRLVSELLALGLPVRSKLDEDPERGLMFDFLRSPPEGPRVLTGHASRLITLNVEEADDAKREHIKQQDALYDPDDPQAERLLSLLNGWIEIVTVLNEMARSMGQPDFYPFVMSKAVVTKLHFIHVVVADARANPGD